MKERLPYPTDLTNKEWAVIEPLLPHDLPPWEAVYAYFRKLQQMNLWQRINDVLRQQVRAAAGREPHPSTLVADSQSVKTTEKGGHVAMMAASA